MSIRRFNPLSIQQPSQDSTLLYIQELIYYAESHFWTIVNEMSKAAIDRQSWIQKLLHRERLFVLSYVGISTALGKAIEIPIIMRSLAESMGLLHEDALPLIMDPGFLATLDMGAHEEDNKSQVNLSITIMSDALVRLKQPMWVMMLVFTSMPDLDRVPVTTTPAQDVLIMATSSETQWKLGLCRASTFHLLHEAAVLKETAGCSAPASATTAQHIGNVARTASSELTRLQSLPASSYKWTWGETLTKAEVLALRQTGTRPGARPHSGYDLSLVEGKMPGDYTEDLPSPPTSHGRNEDLATEAGVAPPITDLSIPPYLLQHDRVSYNPLGCSTLSLMSPSHLIPIIPQDPLPEDLSNILLVMPDLDPEPSAPAPALALADVWTDSDTSDLEEPLKTRALGLADVWSDVQSSDAEAAPAPALLLADNWSDNDEPGGHKIFQPLTPIALLLTDHWDENEGSGNDMTSPALALALAPDILLENMCGGSDHSSIRDNGTECSEYTYGSQLIVSPSRITLDPSSSVPLDTDAYCPLSDNLTPADTPVSTPLRTYGPEHFAYLQDHLFEDSSDEEGD
ncbi:hypothetical protein BYT27DRAFT_7213234 [Phlegmacium glaucopus]|nr:hypothetical protein BYT27DRAFT_7213234 [Phlegmacium glaucopus]